MVLVLRVVEQTFSGLRRPGNGVASVVGLGRREEVGKVLGVYGSLVAEPEVQLLCLVDVAPVVDRCV